MITISLYAPNNSDEQAKVIPQQAQFSVFSVSLSALRCTVVFFSWRPPINFTPIPYVENIGYFITLDLDGAIFYFLQDNFGTLLESILNVQIVFGGHFVISCEVHGAYQLFCFLCGNLAAVVEISSVAQQEYLQVLMAISSHLIQPSLDAVEGAPAVYFEYQKTRDCSASQWVYPL